MLGDFDQVSCTDCDNTGIVIIAVISWAVATFGIQVFHFYERFVWNNDIDISSESLTGILPDLHLCPKSS